MRVAEDYFISFAGRAQSFFWKSGKCCPYEVAPEQKARVTYDNILRLSDDPDVSDVIKFLRAREIVHFQRFGEANLTDLKENSRRAGSQQEGPFILIRYNKLRK